MIPYSFVPGTKAKAAEVNANFIALAEQIENSRTIVNQNVEDLTKLINAKPDKEVTITTVEEADTDLDDYKTSGTYIFTSLYTPLNIPKGDEGMLVVTGDNESELKQIWFDNGSGLEIFTRNFLDSEWSEWQSCTGTCLKSKLGWFRLPNGLLLQWGYDPNISGAITFPLAYEDFVIPVFTKIGCATSGASDTGFLSQFLTGFTMQTVGRYQGLTWVAIGC
jgi:hypothetical protein